MKPIIVDWQITSKCTRHCKFCYGPQEDQEMSTADIFKMVDNFENIGVKVVGITGGEPLVKEDISEILKYIKGKGMAICLSTNGDLYRKNKDAILKYVDTIGIPIESATQDIHDSLRGDGSFESAKYMLEDISKNSDIKFRIGTVVTETNFRDLGNIEILLSKYKDSIIYWKLYEYIVYFPEKQNTTIRVKDKDKVLSIVDNLGKYLDKTSIIYDTLEKRNNSYFLIKPNGDVFVPILNNDATNENVIGNVLYEPEKVVEKWQNTIDPEGYTCSHRCIYRKNEQLRTKYIDCV
ncbi:radical SAM protein [Clostridium akagii]|uniref:radical SAM protein n=1 Tax=Clostridium akagii TaxID=91623 RepID=UPI0004788EC9|nr:radical SAM protein [Clostridium akagii]